MTLDSAYTFTAAAYKPGWMYIRAFAFVASSSGAEETWPVYARAFKTGATAAAEMMLNFRSVCGQRRDRYVRMPTTSWPLQLGFSAELFSRGDELLEKGWSFIMELTWVYICGTLFVARGDHIEVRTMLRCFGYSNDYDMLLRVDTENLEEELWSEPTPLHNFLASKGTE